MSNRRARQKRGGLPMLLIQFALVASVVFGEERSIMEGCTGDTNDQGSNTSSDSAICDGGFTTRFVKSDNIVAPDGSYSKEIRAILAKPAKVLNVYVQNASYSLVWQKRVGKSFIWIGDNATPFAVASDMTKCSQAFFDGGFFKLTAPTTGKYILARRQGDALGSEHGYLFNEIRAFQTPNLFIELAGTLSISAPAAISTDWKAENLITNMSQRSAGNDRPIIIDALSTLAAFKSCYKTNSSILSPEGHNLILTVDLKQVFFVHAFLFVADLIAIDVPTDAQILLENVRVYVGSESDYSLNKECGGGPFMVRGKSNSYVRAVIEKSTGLVGDMWKHGEEVWCNTQGRFITIVSDMSHRSAEAYTVSICNMAAFGTIYERATAPTSFLKVVIGTTRSIEVQKITTNTNWAIGNTLDIKLRQKSGSELPWVTFTDDVIVSKVNFAPDSAVTVDDHNIVIESYDLNGGVFSTLMTDQVKITVLPAECGQALSQTKAFEAAQTVLIVKEYAPITIYFPPILFQGPHTYHSYACGGSYSQSITIDSPVSGVVIVEAPTGTDPRPHLKIDATVVAGTSFTVTFSGQFRNVETETDLSSSIKQTYQLKSVFATSYLDQPAITHALTSADLTFIIPTAISGATPPTHSLSASSFTVVYAFKAGTADSLGNTPPVVAPAPYAGFLQSSLVRGVASLGSVSLANPRGILEIQGADSTGNLNSGTLSFQCPAWTMGNQGVNAPKTLSFVNSFVMTFRASIDVTCAYQAYKAPSFATSLGSEAVISSVASQWLLPNVADGSFPPTKLAFSAPAHDLASSFTFDQTNRSVSFNGAVFGSKFDNMTVIFVLTDGEGHRTPIPQLIELKTYVLPSFSSDIPVVFLKAESAKEWRLPLIQKGTFLIKRIEYVPDTAIEPYVAWDASELKLTYNGGAPLADFMSTTHEAKFTIVDFRNHSSEAYIQKIVFGQSCHIATVDLDLVQSDIAGNPIKIQSLAGQTSLQTASFGALLDKIVTTLAKGQTEPCFTTSVELRSRGGPLLRLDERARMLTLETKAETEAGDYNESILMVKLDTKIQVRTVEIKIEIKVAPCKITSVSFEKRTTPVTYLVGSGTQVVTLPKIKRTPECGSELNEVYIQGVKSSIPESDIRSALTVDPAKLTLAIEASGKQFGGKEATVSIGLLQSLVASEVTTAVKISFIHDSKASEDSTQANSTSTRPGGIASGNVTLAKPASGNVTKEVQANGNVSAGTSQGNTNRTKEEEASAKNETASKAGQINDSRVQQGANATEAAKQKMEQCVPNDCASADAAPNCVPVECRQQCVKKTCSEAELDCVPQECSNEENADAKVTESESNQSVDNLPGEVPKATTDSENGSAAALLGVEQETEEILEVADIEIQVDQAAIALLGIPNLVVPPITKSEQQLLETPVAELPPFKLFTPVPLAARLTNGVDSIKELVWAQRAALANNLTEKKKVNATRIDASPRPPEARLSKFDNQGRLVIGFSSKLVVPEGTEEALKSALAEQRRRLSSKGTFQRRLVEVFAVAGNEVEPGQVPQGLLQEWELTSLNSEGLEFGLTFGNPLQISQGDTPDQLLLQIDLSQLKDKNGVSLPKSVVKSVPIPLQMKSAAEAEKVNMASNAAQDSQKGAIGGNIAVNLLLAQSLGLVWSLINSQQVMLLILLFDVKIPGNVATFTKSIEQMSSFELIEDADQFIVDHLYLPEQDAVSLNLQNAGYLTTYSIANLGTLFYIFFLGQVGLVFVLLFLLLVARFWARAQRWRRSLHYFLFWNGSIRLLMEGFTEFLFFSLININYMEWPEGQVGVTICNAVAIFLTSLCASAPVILFLYTWRNIQRADDENFSLALGAFIDGTKGGKKGSEWGVLLVSLAFFMRRSFLCLTLVFWNCFFWGQVAVQLMITVGMIILIGWTRPFDSNVANNMELFNEWIGLHILYCIMSFSDFVPNAEARNQNGVALIVIICVHAGVHVILMLVDVFRKLKLQALRCYNRRCRKNKNPERIVRKKLTSVLKTIQEVDQDQEEEKDEADSTRHFLNQRSKLIKSANDRKVSARRDSLTQRIDHKGCNEMKQVSDRIRNQRSQMKAQPKNLSPNLPFSLALARPNLSMARASTNSAQDGIEQIAERELINGLEKFAREIDELSDLSNMQDEKDRVEASAGANYESDDCKAENIGFRIVLKSQLQ